jgi:hypothetical protein
VCGGAGHQPPQPGRSAFPRANHCRRNAPWLQP